MTNPKHISNPSNANAISRLAAFGLGSTAVGAGAFAQAMHFGEPTTYPESGGTAGDHPTGGRSVLGQSRRRSDWS